MSYEMWKFGHSEGSDQLFPSQKEEGAGSWILVPDIQYVYQINSG